MDLFLDTESHLSMAASLEFAILSMVASLEFAILLSFCCCFNRLYTPPGGIHVKVKATFTFNNRPSFRVTAPKAYLTGRGNLQEDWLPV